MLSAASDRRFIASMIAALDGEAAAIDALRAPAFRVYRNTVRLGAIDALRANHPAVAQLVGDEWFTAAAQRFVNEQPPASPCLLDYGGGFADFIARLDAVADLPYLPAIATLDRAWNESHCAADAAALTLDQVQALADAGAPVRQHPAARAFWFDDTPAAALWCASRSGAHDLSSIAWQGGGALLTRPHDAVRWTQCDEATVALFYAFANGLDIMVALAQTADRFGAATAGRAFHQLIAQGALTATPTGDTE